jgi:tetratricopeptide (TPR) repeat protein
VIGKYIDPTPGSDSRAEDAFIRAIALNPRLSIAHKFYANLEADTRRTVEAMVRLLNAATRHGNDAELFAGLVHACRYTGLFDESIAAHAEARRLDPTIATGVRQTLLLKRDLDRLAVIEPSESVPGAGEGIRVIGLGVAGRVDEARAALARMGQAAPTHPFEKWRVQHLAAWLDRRVEDMIAGLASVAGSKIFDDPEIIFQQGFMFCDLGEHARGLDYLRGAVARGYFPAVTLTTWPEFDALRDDPGFRTLLAEAEAGRQRAKDAFREAGGERLLAR